MTITEFLLARIAEDRESATQAEWAMQGEWFTTADDQVDAFVQRESPARVLAECAAKRRLVRSAQLALFPDTHRRGTFWDGQRAYAEAVLQELAAVYADHPDYDTAWA